MATTLAIVITHGLTADSAQAEPSPSASIAAIRASSTYRGHTAEEWAGKSRYRTRQLQHVRTHLHERWQPTVTYALRLASAVTGVSYWQLSSVSYCESHHYSFARNGQYRGLFQEGPMFERHPIGQAGFSVFDPIANALVAALTASREGWRQWACR